MGEKPRPQEIYRHFKGNMYQVLTLAIHSETREEMVVYQALYGDYKVYVRPLEMFMSEVDRDKYPTARQKMRFERVTPRDEEPAISAARREPEPSTVRPEPVSQPERREPLRLNLDKKPTATTGVMSKSIDEEATDLNLDPLVIQFMDADLASEKNDILSRLRPTITNDMIDIMAMSVGVVVNEGDVYDRFNDLRNCLTTMEKFESTRLRS